MKNVIAIDLFCGAGGLTHGLQKEGIKVVAGVDLDAFCKYAYEKNNKSQFILEDVCNIKGKSLLKLYPKNSIKVLAGCAPCQPFSLYTQGRLNIKDKKWSLLKEFIRIAKEVDPEIITMENVPQLQKYSIFDYFTSTLKKLGYQVSSQIIFCPEYGIPQTRKRLVLLASKYGEINMIKPQLKTDEFVTVKDAIGLMPPIFAGETHEKDPLHKARKMSPINLARIRASKPGGSWKDWDDALISSCHKKEKGKGYVSVYGRMSWDKPSPTITTHCTGFGNGRFGHPEQDRALSLREAAMLQTFPKNYKFFKRAEDIPSRSLSTLIGNAVPVKLGCAIGKSIKKHVYEYGIKYE